MDFTEYNTLEELVEIDSENLQNYLELSKSLGLKTTSKSAEEILDYTKSEVLTEIGSYKVVYDAGKINLEFSTEFFDAYMLIQKAQEKGIELSVDGEIL